MTTYYIADGYKIYLETFDHVDKAYAFIKSQPKLHESNDIDVYQVFIRSEHFYAGIIKENQYAGNCDFRASLLPIYELIHTLKVHHKEYKEIEYIT